MSAIAPAVAAVASPAALRRLFLACAWESPPAVVLEAMAARADDREAWEAVAALARRVGQEPLLLRFLACHGLAASVGEATRQDLAAQSQYHAFRWEGLRAAVAALLGALHRRGIRPILLKGISLAGELYDPPHLRPMRDVDVLVRPGELEAARAAALEAGFRDDASPAARAAHAGHHHLPPFFHGETGTCVELHRGILHPRHALAGFPAGDALWHETRASRLFPDSADVLEPSLGLLVLCAHVTHGDSIGRRAQNLIDVARFVERHGSSLDWDRVASHAATPAVARALAVPLGYLAREGLAAAPAACLEDLQRRSGLRSWELELLWALTDRYRLGSPPGWPLVSGRLANVLWRQAMRDAGLLRRAAAFLGEALTGR